MTQIISIDPVAEQARGRGGIPGDERWGRIRGIRGIRAHSCDLLAPGPILT